MMFFAHGKTRRTRAPNHPHKEKDGREKQWCDAVSLNRAPPNPNCPHHTTLTYRNFGSLDPDVINALGVVK
ncbi:hypothetical protein C4D60_Mb07t23790 [Musa balbisiana]|uniref:Uncharacterized protein n=1 Tax=Musa balbisiana TaxID=52838 RepID=A0A4S8JHJ4_MUSBA|nr:hypothetical protein C4D60_Mb07t23790 [Musa balbisiana]